MEHHSWVFIDKGTNCSFYCTMGTLSKVDKSEVTYFWCFKHVGGKSGIQYGVRTGFFRIFTEDAILMPFWHVWDGVYFKGNTLMLCRGFHSALPNYKLYSPKLWKFLTLAWKPRLILGFQRYLKYKLSHFLKKSWENITPCPHLVQWDVANNLGSALPLKLLLLPAMQSCNLKSDLDNPGSWQIQLCIGSSKNL